VPTEWQSRLPELAPDGIPDALRDADAALAHGLLEQGTGDVPGALEVYLAVLQLAPDDARAERGVRATLEALLERGRLAMRAGDLAMAEHVDAVAAAVLPDHRDLAVYRERLSEARRAQAAVARADAAARKGALLTPAKDSAAFHLAAALAEVPDFKPALDARARWNATVLARAWAAAKAEDYRAADALLRESARFAPGSVAQRVMDLRIIEARKARSDALLAEGNRAVDRLLLDRADRILIHATRVAAQPSGPAALRARIHLARHYGPFAPAQVFSDRLRLGGVGPEMVVIPYGRFRMGAGDEDPDATEAERPPHEVVFARGFAIGRSEVTVGEFGRFIAATHFRTHATRVGHSIVYDEKGGVLSEHEGVDWRRDHVGRIASTALPVVHVTLDDARAYARWLSAQAGAKYRLPSEAEFEYVLRAGSTTRYPWGTSSPRRVVGNLPGDGDLSRSMRRWGNAIPGYRDAFWGPSPVRNFAPEKFGTYDMIGNVSEWTLDCWHEGYQRAPADGSAWVNPGCPQHVVRGASWGSSLEQARSASRLPVDATTSNARLGFRVVREL
jgi:formylglycine-generating enzyme required for sulfatase activity